VIADESAEAGDDDEEEEEEEEECEESSSADEGLTQQASVRHATAMALVVGHLLQPQTTANCCTHAHSAPQSSRERTYPNRGLKALHILNRYLTMVWFPDLPLKFIIQQQIWRLFIFNL
jgi:hypothetical protein